MDTGTYTAYQQTDKEDTEKTEGCASPANCHTLKEKHTDPVCTVKKVEKHTGSADCCAVKKTTKWKSLELSSAPVAIQKPLTPVLRAIPEHPSAKDFTCFIRTLMMMVNAEQVSLKKAHFYLACIKTIHSIESSSRLSNDVKTLEECLSVRYKKTYASKE